MLRVSLFGHLRAAEDRDALDLSAVTAVLPMWAYLLLHRHEALPRRHVAFTLYPDSPESEALAHLRRQLHILQRTLPSAAAGRPWIIADRMTVRWNPDSDYWLDVEEFEARSAPRAASATSPKLRPPSETSLERAIALYTRDLLVDLYDDWVLRERERLRQMYARALGGLLALRAARGALRNAAQMADQLVGIDDLCEDSYRLAIGLHYLAGDRGAALAAYDACQHVLRTELDAEPMPETSRLAESVRQSRPSTEIVDLIRPVLPEGLCTGHLLRRTVPNNLRMQLTSFVGREKEMTQLRHLLDTSRLVTLTGPGGCGKSRLALEVAGTLLSGSETPAGGQQADGGRARLPDGVWWVDLASVDEPGLLPQAVAETLGLTESPGATPSEVLEREAGPKALLLVLDNAEHVAEACAMLTDRLLQAGADVRVLVTSRQLLGIAGEVAVPVQPLNVPPEARLHEAAEVLHYEAPRLFVERARLAAPSFRMTPSDLPLVGSLTRRLDGIPLAVELAAAQVATLSLEQLSASLDERLSRPTSGSADGGSRYSSMRAAIEWSFELLSAPERLVAIRTAVFRGGWTVEAAEAVCSGEGVDAAYIPVLLTTLVSKSLVTTVSAYGTRRYAMLATTRDYAMDRLTSSGEATATRAKHLAHYTALAAAAEGVLRGPEQAMSLRRLAAEHGNFRAALSWGAGREGSSEATLGLACSLGLYWYIRGDLSEGGYWLRRLLHANPRAPAELRAKALNASGRLAYRQGDFASALSLYEAALELWRSAGDELNAGRALGNLGMVATDRGDYVSGQAYFEASLHLLQQRGDKRGVANALGNLGSVAFLRDELEAARDYFERCLAIDRELDDEWGIASSLQSLARLAGDRGETGEAIALLEEGIELYRRLGDKASVAEALDDLATLAYRAGDLTAAKHSFVESLELHRDVGKMNGIAHALRGIARVQLAEGDVAKAEDLAKESVSRYGELGDLKNLVTGLSFLGKVCVAAGATARAARLWGAAETLSKAADFSLAVGEDETRGEAAKSAAARLGQAAYDAAYAEGRAMTMEAAIAYALEGFAPETEAGKRTE